MCNAKYKKEVIEGTPKKLQYLCPVGEWYTLVFQLLPFYTNCSMFSSPFILPLCNSNFLNAFTSKNEVDFLAHLTKNAVILQQIDLKLKKAGSFYQVHIILAHIFNTTTKPVLYGPIQELICNFPWHQSLKWPGINNKHSTKWVMKPT